MVFSAPTNTGGAAITGYKVTASTGQTSTGSISPITVTGLTNGTPVTFTVTATNGANLTSIASVPSNSVTPRASTLTTLASNAMSAQCAQTVTFTATVSAGATGSVTILDGATTLDIASLINGAATYVTNALPVGTHSLTAVYSGDSSHLPSTSTVLTQMVTPAVLTVTANVKTRAYGVANPELTSIVTGFINGDTASVVSGSAVLSTPAVETSPAGSYPITVDVSGMSATNYVFAGSVGTLMVSQAVLTVTADVKSRIYGSDNPTLTGTVTGFLNGDDVNVVIGSAAFSTPAVITSSVGSYPIDVDVSGMSSSNYTFAAHAGTLIVDQAPQTITMQPIGGSVPFGSGPFSLSATASSGLPVTFAVSGPAMVEGNTLNITGAGSVVVTASQVGDANYLGAPSVSRSIEITRAAQTITFDPIANQVYGVEPISLSASSSADLPVSFRVISGPAEIVGNGSLLAIEGGGEVIVGASQSGDSNYSPAEVNQVIHVRAPYGLVEPQIPGTVEVENYDLGGNGLAYNDTSPQVNIGNYLFFERSYRPEEGVDVFAMTNEHGDDTGGFAVGWFYDREWMEYTVEAAAGIYDLGIRYATPEDGVAVQILIDGTDVFPVAVPLPSTGGWQTWATAHQSGTTIAAGRHVIRVQNRGVANLDSLSFTVISRPAVNLTGGDHRNGAFPVTCAFDQPVKDFTVEDVSIIGGTISDFAGEGASYHWTVTPNASTVNVAVEADRCLGVNGSLANVASNSLVVSYPTVNLTSTVAAVRKMGSAFTVTATFSEAPEATFSLNDVTVVNGTVSALAGKDIVRTFLVTPRPLPAGLKVQATTVTVAAASWTNSDGVVNILASNTITSVQDIESPRPTMTSIAPASVNGPFDIAISWSERVMGFAMDDLTVTNGTLDSFMNDENGMTFSVHVTPTANGRVTVALAAGKATDVAGNGSTSATLYRNVDMTAPTVTITRVTATTTNAAVISARVVFNEAVTGFTAEDVVVSNASVRVTPVNAQSYMLEISPLADGDVAVQVPGNSGSDAAGNGNILSNVVTWISDRTPPTIVLELVRDDLPGEAVPVHPIWIGESKCRGPFVLNLLASEQVIGLRSSDLQLTNATVSGFAGSGGTYTCTINPLVEGVVTIGLPAGAAVDAAGNPSGAVNLIVNAVDLNNDALARSRQITGTGEDTSTWLPDATRENNENVFGSIGAGHTLWWTYTAQQDDVLYLSTANSSLDTILAVATGTAVYKLTVLGLVDDTMFSSQAELGVKVQAGQVYRIMIDMSAREVLLNGPKDHPSITLTWNLGSQLKNVN